MRPRQAVVSAALTGAVLAAFAAVSVAPARISIQPGATGSGPPEISFLGVSQQYVNAYTWETQNSTQQVMWSVEAAQERARQDANIRKTVIVPLCKAGKPAYGMTLAELRQLCREWHVLVGS